MTKVISFEGIEGTGKTTLVGEVVDKLSALKYRVHATSEPYGELATFIRRFMLNRLPEEIPPLAQVFLFEAARALHVDVLRKKAFGRAHFIIIDRFVDSTLAYQGYGLGVEIDFIELVNRRCVGDLFPSRTFLLDLDPFLAMSRIYGRVGNDAWDKNVGRFVKRVREGYLNIARKNKDRMHVLNAGLKKEELSSITIEQIIKCND